MPRAVLAVLLLRANEVVSSDQLVEALWAGAAPASGAKGLHVHVSRLRRALAAGDSDQDGERLVTTAGGYVLRVGPEELDVQRCERLIGEGKTIPEAAKAIEISEQTYHRWRNQYGGMKANDAKRLKELERENATLKRIVADQVLEVQALKEISRGNW